jgi:hypothetical protein
MRLKVLCLTLSVAVSAVTAATARELRDSSEPQHCGYRLDDVASQDVDVSGNETRFIGCFDTYADVVAAGTEGTLVVADGTNAEELTDPQVAAAMGEMAASESVLIGTEWDSIGYDGPSNSYFASATCSATQTWSVSDLGSTWNNRFSSGKGFGGCDHNRKFQLPGFDGGSLACTPNCNTYGSLSNRVSSLRWRE